MRHKPFPELSREELAQLSSWSSLRRARSLRDKRAVHSLSWKAPVLGGEVRDGGEVYVVELDLRSLTFVRNRCNCREGRSGRICVHALALYLEGKRREDTATLAGEPAKAPVREPGMERPQAAAEPPSGPKQPSGIRIDENGEPLRPRLVLPPNLEAAARRNAIVVKLELILAGGGSSPEKLFRGRSYRVTAGAAAVLAELEELCGGRLCGLLQLKREMLRRLLLVPQEEVEIRQGTSKADLPAEERTALAAGLVEAEPAARKAASPRRSPGVRPEGPKRDSSPPPPSQRDRLPANWMVVDGSPKFLAILLRDRDHPQYRRCVEWLRTEGFRKEPSNGKWWLRDQHKVLNFLALERERLESHYDVAYTENFQQRCRVLRSVRPRAEARRKGEGFVLEVKLEGEGIEGADIRRALSSGCHYVHGKDRIFLLGKSCVEKFTALGQSLGEDPQRALTGRLEVRLGAASLADAEALLEDLEGEVALPADWKQRSEAIRHVGKLAQPPLPASFADRLRTYQLVGTAWLWHLYRNGLGGILADEMGLGKTIQAIGLLHCLRSSQPDEGSPPSLVVAPASLLGNWRRELGEWAPELRVHLHHGPGRLELFEEGLRSADVLVTSYSTLRNDVDRFETTDFSLIIADEAQHVKNRRTHAARALRAAKAPGRFVLTGTPVENSMEDLRSLFAFCLPGYLRKVPRDIRGEERDWYDRRHRGKAAPYILRRGKREVAPELPEKIEQVLWVDLSAEQRALYERWQRSSEEEMMKLASANVSENRLRFALLTQLLRLRQICADPGMLVEDFPLEASAKYAAFRELLAEAVDGGHRILVFSQFVRLLKRLRAKLEGEGWPVAYIDGQTRDRLAVCDHFNAEPGIPVCLVSLKAGGTGLTLTGADTVVHFDPWWNPAVEDQATDRAHRIGQERRVTSYKLVSEGTVEDKVRALQLKKASLLRDILDESRAETSKVDLATLQSLLQQHGTA